MKINAFVIAILMAFISNQISAQDINTQAYELINNENYFALNELLNTNRAEFQPLALNLSQAVLANAFNHPEKGISAINAILNDKLMCASIGIESQISFAFLKAEMLYELHRFKEARQSLETLKSHLDPAILNQDLTESINEYIRINKGLANGEPMKIKRPGKDIEIDILTEACGKGYSLFLFPEINGKKVKMTLDTGNPKHSLVNLKTAKELGLTILVDSIPMSGVGEGYARIASAKSMKLGAITIENPYFYVVDNISPSDTISIDPVFGSDILNALHAIKIYPTKNKAIFPHTIKERDANMVMNSRHLFIHTDDNQLFHFDTGSTNSNLNHRYFNNHKAEIMATAEKDSIRIAGFGGVSIHEGYKLPHFTFSLNGETHTLNNLSVYTIELMNIWKETACIGSDFVKEFSCLEINYQHMYIRIEE